MPINGELVVGQVEAQAIAFLALEVRKARFLSVLAWMFELGLGSFLFHAPVVGEGLPQIGKGLFGSAFRDLIAPGKLLAFDFVVLRLEVFHFHSFALCSCFFPVSECPFVCVAANTTSFAKDHLLLRPASQPGLMLALHYEFFSGWIVSSNSP